MSIGQEVEASFERFEQPLTKEAARLLGVPFFELVDWQVNRIREDGAIDAYVPLEIVDVANVPTDPRNVKRLVNLFEERAEEVGGTGQRDPVVIGHVPGDAFYMLDGFHRHEVQLQRGQSHLHATVEPSLTYEQVVKRRLEYAHTHPEVEFARQVEWMQSVWEKTPWSETVPNILTAFRAFQDDYAYDHTDDIELIDSLSEDMFQQIRRWVSEQSKEWGYTPAQIRENLAKVESFDPSLMSLVYQKVGPPPAGRISLKHVEVITATYPGEFDLQKAVADIIVDRELSVVHTEALISALEHDNPVTPQDVYESAQKVDFLRLKARSVKPKPSTTNTSKRNGVAADLPPDLDASGVMAAMRKLLPQIKKRASNGLWGAGEKEDALEIAVTLSEILAQLSLQAADVSVEEAGSNA